MTIPSTPPDGWSLYEGMIPGRVMFVQAFGHGPVYYRTFGVMQAYCVHPGCAYTGRDRGRDPEMSFADAVVHLELETGTEWDWHASGPTWTLATKGDEGYCGT